MCLLIKLMKSLSIINFLWTNLFSRCNIRCDSNVGLILNFVLNRIFLIRFRNIFATLLSWDFLRRLKSILFFLNTIYNYFWMENESRTKNRSNSAVCLWNVTHTIVDIEIWSLAINSTRWNKLTKSFNHVSQFILFLYMFR